MGKRSFDLLVAVAALVVVSPVMALVAAMIKVDSPGPTFHRAYRVGRHGREFRLWKFRTMVANAHKHGPPITRRDDPRITRVGRFLRRWKIDELPQLLNVIRGEMSLVGPRPEDPTYVAVYTREQRHILNYRPGITSPASIAFRNEEDILYYGALSSSYLQTVLPTKLTIDLAYFEHRSFGSDLATLARTTRVVLRGSLLTRIVSCFATRRFVWLLLDGTVVVVGFHTALLVRVLDSWHRDLALYLATLESVIVPVMTIYAGVNHLWRLHRRLWRYASAPEVIAIFIPCAVSTGIVGILDFLLGVMASRPLPMSVIVLGGFFTFIGMVLVRYWARLLGGLRRHGPRDRRETRRALIYGAGENGQLLAWRLRMEASGTKHDVIGFIDDDPAKRGLRVHNVPVLGTRDDLERIVDERAVDLIILAMSNIGGEQLRAILSSAQRTRAQIRIIPSWLESIANSRPTPLLREVRVEDLLGRPRVVVDSHACATVLSGKVVLVTGGSGSVGAELCRQIGSFAPEQLVVLDNNESALHDLEIEMRALCPDLEVVSIVGDVTDGNKMDDLFREMRPHIVFHAAAYKHVPLMQRYPEEAVRVNVGGTLVALDKARLYRSERFVLVSTDKAVNPESVMGATKRLAELLVLYAQRQVKTANLVDSAKPLCTAVRFGNVLGSRGSVVPVFAKQIELGGPVTVTHPEMTRYFMEISEAATLIIQAAAFTEGGEVFMLDMGERIRVDDLARKMIRMRGLRPDRDIAIAYVGIRPGEKLHEELLLPEEARVATQHPLIYRITEKWSEGPTHIDAGVRILLRMAANGRRRELVDHLMAFTRPGATATASRRRDAQSPATNQPSFVGQRFRTGGAIVEDGRDPSAR